MKLAPLLFSAVGSGLALAMSNKEDKAFHAVLLGLAGYGIGSLTGDVVDSAEEAEKDREAKQKP